MEETNLSISGQGGGGKGGGGTPSTEKDSLDSKAHIKILEALSEGEIEGFATARDELHSPGTAAYNKAALKDIFLDDTPILSADADSNNVQEEDYNYENVEINLRHGTGSQAVIPGYEQVETEIAVGKPVSYTAPVDSVRAGVVETFTGGGIDQLRITISIPQLQRYEDDGDIKGSSFRVVGQIAYDDAGFLPGSEGAVLNDLVEGRTGDLYQKSYLINLGTYTNQVKIKLIRWNEDGNSKNMNAFTWFSYTKIINSSLTYPNTALAGIQASSEDFTSLPNRSYMLKGIKCRIPTNATPIASGKNSGTLQYSGSWGGQWKVAYTTCPSWILYDLLTSQRYGSGDEILTAAEKANFTGDTVNIDKYSFYSASVYANELVSDRRDNGTLPSGVWRQLTGTSRVVQINTDSEHKLQKGDQVTVTFTNGQVNSNPVNGTYSIRAVNKKSFKFTVANTFSPVAATYVQAAGNGTTSTILTVTTPSAHTFVTGVFVNLDFSLGEAKTGDYKIQTVPTSTTFTVIGKIDKATSGTLNIRSKGGACSIVKGTNESTEPRFAFNGIINGRVPAFDLINSICSTMRAMPYWSAGGLTLSIDKPTDVSYIFNNSNVLAGGFTYEGSDIKSRATLVVARYFCNQKRKIDYVQDPIDSDISSDSWISKYGINKKEVDAFGCTSSGQASRLARWIRFSENNLTQTVTFKTSIDAGVVVRPGAVIGVSDKTIAGQRRGGRVRATTASTLTIDETSANLPYGRRTGTGTYAQSGTTITVTTPSNHFYEAGSRITLDFTSGSAGDNTFTILSSPAPTARTFAVNYGSSGTNSGNVTYTCPFTRTLHVLMPDGSVDSNTVDWIRYPTSYAQINISGNFQVGGTDTLPNVNAPWILESSGGTSTENLQQTLWRVISVTEENSGTEFKITALEYNESAYAHVEGGNDVTYRDGTNLDEKPQRPETLTVKERLYKESINQDPDKTSNSEKVKAKLIFTWDEVPGISAYLLKFRKNNTNWQQAEVNGLDYEIFGVKGGDVFRCRVYSIRGSGKKSLPRHLSGANTTTSGSQRIYTCLGKTEPPSDVSGFSVSTDRLIGPILTWTENAPNPDFDNGESVNPQVEFKDLDIDNYEIRKENVGNEWGNNGYFTRAQTPDVIVGEFPIVNTTYYIKARDDGGRLSTDAVSVTFTYVQPSAVQGLVSRLENNTVIVEWSKPSTHVANGNGSYAISHYILSFTGQTIEIESDINRYEAPLDFPIGSSRTYTITAVDIGGGGTTTATKILTVPDIGAPTNGAVKFGLDTFTLSWEKPVKETNQPDLIGYRIYRGDTEIAQIQGTEFTLPVTKANFPTLTQNYKVAGVYVTPSFPGEGKASINKLTISVAITNASAPTITKSFSYDKITLSWGEVNGSLKTIRYGIYDNSDGSLIAETDSTSFSEFVNYTSKTYQVKALSSAYIKESEANKSHFVGATGTLAVTINVGGKPTFVLDNEESSHWWLVNKTIHMVWGEGTKGDLGVKDYKITRHYYKQDEGGNEVIVIDEIFYVEGLNFSDEINWKLRVFTETGVLYPWEENRYYDIQRRDAAGNLSPKYTDSLGTPGIRPELGLPGQPRGQETNSSPISEVIDNNVLLRWYYGGGYLPIDYYEIRRIPEADILPLTQMSRKQRWDTAKFVTTTKSLFVLLFETKADTYRYLIRPFDVVKNAASYQDIKDDILQVSQPPDFVLNADFYSTFDTSPSEVDSNATSNCLIVDDAALGKKVAYIPVNTTETWTQHFTTNSQTTMAGFNSAGHQGYLEPAPTTGYYEEVYNYGTVLASTKISGIVGSDAIGSGSTVIKGKIETAGASGDFTTDGVEQTGNSYFRFGTQFQRVKYRTTIDSTDGQYRKIQSLNLKIDTKILNDTGKGNIIENTNARLQGNGTYSQVSSTTITVTMNNHGMETGCYATLNFTNGGQSNSGDGEYYITKVNDNSFTVQASSSGSSSGDVSFNTSGTPQYFNVDYVDVQSVTVTPNTTSAVLCVVDFKDVPNPKSFQVLFFNPTNANSVTSGKFTWQARGT
tara:strand:- start:4261 stop:10353 length:6093 start_codon:yes stop_codon:yes gene_type:complete